METKIEKTNIREVMDTKNGHNKELVWKINHLFNDVHTTLSRRYILFAIAQRDEEEVAEKLNIRINTLEDADKYTDELLENVCNDNDLETIIHFCYGDMDYSREVKLRTLRDLIKQRGGKLKFDGSFSFVGDDLSDAEFGAFCEDTKLTGLEVDENYRLVISDIWQGNNYTNSENFLPYFELDRIIEYVKAENNRETLLKEIRYQLDALFGNHWSPVDIDSLFENIKDLVADDVVETSDYPNYNTDDIQIAIRRVLMKKVEREN